MIMKTINVNKILATMLLMLLVSYASANDPILRVAGEKKLVMNIDIVTKNTELAIKDVNGFTLYTETIVKSDDKYIKIFDLSKLPNGSYEVVVEDSLKLSTFSFNIINNRIPMAKLEKTENYKPIFVEKGNKVYVSKYNPGNLPLNITISDSNNDVVYEEALEGKMELVRVINFSETKGDYNIAIQSDGKTFTQEISIQK